MAESTVKVTFLGENSKLKRAIDDSESKLSSFGAKLARIGAAAGAAVAAAGVGAAVGLFKVGESFNKEFDKIRVGTGATGDALAGLEGAFKNVLKNVPASFDSAGTAIADLNTRLGLTGKPLESLAGQFINLSRITGGDVKANVDNITRVFGDWGVAVGDQSGTLDKLYRAAQASGISIEELSTKMVQAGAPLRNVGFSIDESTALLALFNKTGVNTDTVLAGMKAGVGKLAKAGEDVPTTFQRVVKEIQALGPGSEATAKAIALFGQRSGPDLADAITGGKFALDDMLKAIVDGEDTINGAAKDTEDFGEKWQRFKNRVLVGLQPLATKVFDGIGKLMDKLGPKFDVLMRKASAVLGAIVDWVVKHWPQIKQVAEQVWDAVVQAFRKVVDVIQEKVIPAVRAVFDFLMRHKEILVGVAAAIAVGLVAAFVSWAAAAAAAAAATIAATAPIIAIGAAIAALVAGVIYAYKHWDWFREAVNAVRDFIVDKLVPAFQAIWSFIQDKVIPIIATLVGTYIKVLVAEFKVIKAVITDVVIPAFQAIWSFIQDKVIPIIGAIASKIGEVASAVGSKVGEIVGFITGIPGQIGGVVGTMFDGIKFAATAAKDWVWEKLDFIVTLATNLPGKMRGLFSGMWDGIKEAFRSAINWVIRGWNSLEFKMPSFDTHIPGVGKVGGFTIGVPDIPTLHSGGIVPGVPGSDVLAVLQAGERVIPRSQAGNSGNTYNVTVNAGLGTDPRVLQDAVARAIKTVDRRNGTNWRAA